MLHASIDDMEKFPLHNSESDLCSFDGTFMSTSVSIILTLHVHQW